MNSLASDLIKEILSRVKERCYWNSILTVSKQWNHLGYIALDICVRNEIFLCCIEDYEESLYKFLFLDGISIEDRSCGVATAYKFGYREMSLLVIERTTVDLSPFCTSLLLSACEIGDIDMIDRLFRMYPNLDPSFDGNHCIIYASTNGHLEIVDRLLQDPRVDPTVNDNKPIVSACENDHAKVVERLLQDSRVDPNVSNDLPLREACSNGHLEVVRLLFSNKKVQPMMGWNYWVGRVIEQGYLDIAEWMFQDARISTVPYNDIPNECMKNACMNNKIAQVKRMLQDPRVDPTINDNLPLRKAVNHGNHKVTELLLQDPRVDPSSISEDLLFNPCYYWWPRTLDALLNDPRINPSVNDFNPILTAFKRRHNKADNCEKHIQIVNRLLRDPRVDPSLDDNEALILAYKSNCKAIKRILQDPRVDPTVLLTKK